MGIAINYTVAIIVIVYMLLMIGVGFFSSTKIKSNTDFMVAGRRLGPIMMAGTLAATEIGGGSSLGVVQNGMDGYGLSAAWYIIAMGIAFIILSFVAPKLRTEAVKTVPEYFRRRYGKATGLITAVISFIPLVGLTAGQFIASAVILSTMLGISYHVAVVITAFVVTIYSVLGGLWGVTLTDNIQVFLIVIGMVIALPFALNYAGGFEQVAANVPKGTFMLLGGPGKSYTFMAVISLVIMYFGTFVVGQEAVSRFYAAKDGKAAKKGAWYAAGINFIFAFIPTILGIITLALINMGKFDPKLFEGVGSRYALPVLAMHTMPSIICGLLFAGIISATMSSSDSDLLGAGSIFANDIYKQVIKKDATSDQVMKVTKTVMLIVGFFSLLIAYFNTSNIVTILMFCFTLRAAGTVFPYVFGLYWKKSSTAGTIASLIAGTIVVVAVDNMNIPMLLSIKKFFGGQSIVPGLIVALVCFIAFSMLIPPKKETTELIPEADD